MGSLDAELERAVGGGRAGPVGGQAAGWACRLGGQAGWLGGVAGREAGRWAGSGWAEWLGGSLIAAEPVVFTTDTDTDTAK